MSFKYSNNYNYKNNNQLKLFGLLIVINLLRSILPAYTYLNNYDLFLNKLRQENSSNIYTNATVSKNNRLLSITLVGGLCIDGLCREEIVINKDGSYTYKDTKHRKRTGVLDQKDTAVLNFISDRTDFNQIKSKKFEGTCPTAYDGTEKTYTFYILGRVEAFSDCQVQIDQNHPLFKRIEIIINEITVLQNK